MAQISIAVVSDTKQAAASVKQLSTEYSGLVDQLRALGPDGAASADQLESSMKAAQIATQDAATASQQLVMDINKAKVAAAEQGVDFQATSERVGMGGQAAAGGLKAVNDEGKKLKEGLAVNASFGLPMLAESLGAGEGGVAGTAMSAATALGGMGMMMGPEVAIPAAALGGILAWVATQLGNTDAEAQAVTKSAQGMSKEFNSDYPMVGRFAQALAGWAEDASDYGITLSELEKDTGMLGVSFGQAAAAMVSTNVPALEKLKAATDAQVKSLKDQDLALRNQRANNILPWQDQLTEADKKQAEAAEKAASAGTELSKAYERRIKAAKEAQADEKAEANALGLTVKQFQAYSKAMSDASEETGEFASSLDSVNDQKADPSKAFDVKQYLANLKAVETANQNFIDAQNTMIQDGLNQSGEDFVAKNQETAAAAWAAAKGNPKEQAALVAAWNTAGAQSAEKFGEEIGEGIAKALQDAKTKASKADIVAKMRVDDSALKKAIAAQYNVVVPVSFSYAAGKKIE